MSIPILQYPIFQALAKYQDTPRLLVSNSSMGMLRTGCVKKFAIQKLLNYRIWEEGEATMTGSVVHEAWQLYLHTRNVQEAEAHLVMHFNLRWQKSAFQTRSLYGVLTSLSTLITYTDRYIFPFYDLAYLSNGEPATEVKFQINIDGFNLGEDNANPIGVGYIGFIDAVLRAKNTGNFIPFDLKTSTLASYYGEIKYAHSAQVLPYGMILEQIMGHTQDAKWDALGFNIHYLELVMDWLEPAVYDYPFYKTMDDITKWGKDLIHSLTNLKFYLAEGFFPERDSACIAWQKPCRYQMECDLKSLDSLIAQVGRTEIEEAEVFVPYITTSIKYATGA